MEDYNQQDAKSVLEYIYRNYGKTVFQKREKQGRILMISLHS